MTHKRCSRCRQALPREQFSKNKASRDGLQNNCKRCCMEWWENWQLSKNPNYKVGARRRARQPQLTEATKIARYRFRRYGITPCAYARMRIEQGDVCRLCDKPESVKGRTLAVDHDHESGKVRGLLCGRCNTALGALGDSVAGLERALAYLRESATTE